MGLNTLTNKSPGNKISATDPNELIAALVQALVGRNASGVATAGQSLGTSLIPWGPIYGASLIIAGSAIDVGLLSAKANRVVSGRVRTDSAQVDFVRASGSGLSGTILATATNLLLSINGSEVTVATDIALTGLTAEPGVNNTALVNDVSLTGTNETKYQGEENTVITIGTVGAAISAKLGQFIALGKGSEIMYGYLRSATEFVQAYRGFCFDSSGAPKVRETLSNGDTLTLLSVDWIFVENDGVTFEATTTTPAVTFEEPAAPADGDYWLDLTNAMWKRYDSAAWIQINRTLVGITVSDTTNTIGSRSLDPYTSYDTQNDIEIEVKSDTELRTRDPRGEVGIYGEELDFDGGELVWTMPADIETGAEASDTTYYAYVSMYGERILSVERPYKRNDLKGSYHPYHAWRCVGAGYNNASSHFKKAMTKGHTVISSRLVVESDLEGSPDYLGTFRAGAPEDTTAKILIQGSANATADEPAALDLGVWDFDEGTGTATVLARITAKMGATSGEEGGISIQTANLGTLTDALIADQDQNAAVPNGTLMVGHFSLPLAFYSGHWSPSMAPIAEFRDVANSAAPYEEGVVIRHAGTSGTGNRTLGYWLKMSVEANATESNKGGGIALRSATASVNNSELYWIHGAGDVMYSEATIRYMNFTRAIQLDVQATDITTPTDRAGIYSKDMGGRAGEAGLYTKAENGEVTQLSGGPAFHATLSADQTGIVSSAIVAFNTETFDIFGCFGANVANQNTNDAANRFAPDVAGIYAFTFHGILTSMSAVGTFSILKNGTTYALDQQQLVGTTVTGEVHALIQLNGTTDYVEAFVQGDVLFDVNSTSSNTYFSGHRVA